MTTLDFDGIHKAAVLLSGLDWEKADDLLKRLDETEARAVRNELARLQNITEEEIRHVAESFLHQNRKTVNRDSFDIFEPSQNVYPLHYVNENHHESYLRQPQNTVSREKIQADPLPDHRFQFLEEMSPLETASFLVDESPQVIVLVLSELSPQFSGETLLCFEQELRSDLIQRLSVLEETSEIVIDEIEKLIRTRYDSLKSTSNQPNRKNVLDEILKHADEQMEQEILMSMEYQQIAPISIYDIPPMEITFEHLGLFEDHELAAIYHAISPEIAAMSLMHVDPDFLTRVFNFYSEENKFMLNDFLIRYRGISLEEIQYARQCVLRGAIRLMEQGSVPDAHCLTSYCGSGKN